VSASLFAEAADPTRIVLSASWGCLMFVYLLGDVLRVYAGHYTPGEIEGASGGWMWVVAATFMLIPVAMILVSLTVPSGPLVWVTIVASVVMVVINVAGLPYEGAFDNMLIVVSLLVSAFTVWMALTGFRAEG